MKRHLAFLVATATLLVALLVMIVFQRGVDFRRHHQVLAKEAASSTAQMFAEFLRERQRLVQLFSNENGALLADLARSPQDKALHARVEQKIANHFPNYFAFTLAKTDGEPIIDDFDGKIGEVCVNDIQRFANSRHPEPRVHPNDKAYHFDVIAHFASGDATGILFVSFHADMLGTFLRAIEPPDHQLLLIYPPAGDLIEANAQGSRLHLRRDDYRLSTQEKARILARESVPNSSWQVVDLNQPQLFSTYGRDLVTQSVLVFLLFSAISAAMTWSVWRAERMRMEAERRKDEFLAVISHEIRTPLTSIRGALGLFSGGVVGPLGAQAKELVDISLRNCERLILLINDLLDVRKMEEGKLEYHIQPQALLPVIVRAIENSRGYAEKFGASIELRETLPEVKVNIDALRIEQVLSNLLSNAIKYGRDAENVEVSMQLHDKHVFVRVSDHGQGIPYAFRHRVFEKFSQADGSTARKVEGTGLGLSIVKMIIEQQQGTVGFESHPGEGSTFYFALPTLDA